MDMRTLAFLILAAAVPAMAFAGQRRANPGKIADVHYGEHKAQVLDLYLAKSGKPTPLLIFIHGGGFRFGNKNSVGAEKPGNIHHPNFGRHLEGEMKKLGLECVRRLSGDKNLNNEKVEWIRKHFKMGS